jgi:hypothetical protein
MACIIDIILSVRVIAILVFGIDVGIGIDICRFTLVFLD